MTFEEEKDYNKAKLDVIKAMNSIQKLKPELREQLLKELAVQRHACRCKSQRSDLQHYGNSKGKQPCAQRLYPVPFRESA